MRACLRVSLCVWRWVDLSAVGNAAKPPSGSRRRDVGGDCPRDALTAVIAVWFGGGGGGGVIGAGVIGKWPRRVWFCLGRVGLVGFG